MKNGTPDVFLIYFNLNYTTKIMEFTKTDGSDSKGKYGSLSRSAAKVELILGVEVLPVSRADAAVPCLSLSWVEIIMYYYCMMIFRTA